MNGREYNVSGETCESKWAARREGHEKGPRFPTSWGDLCEISCESVAAFLVANRARDTRACAEIASHRAQV